MKKDDHEIGSVSIRGLEEDKKKQKMKILDDEMQPNILRVHRVENEGVLAFKGINRIARFLVFATVASAQKREKEREKDRGRKGWRFVFFMFAGLG